MPKPRFDEEGLPQETQSSGGSKYKLTEWGGNPKLQIASTPDKPQWEKKNKNIPPIEDWDYQTSPIGPRGEQLPEGAQQWKPDGLPYFGEGLPGKLKEYWYNFTKDVPNTASVEEMTNLWNQSKKTIQADKNTPYWQQDNPYSEQFRKNILNAFSGKGAELTPEQIAQRDELAKKQKAGQQLSQEESTLLKDLSKQNIDQSSLSGVRRAVNVGVAAGLDLFNFAAEKTEQAIGAVRGGAEELNKQAGGEQVVDTNRAERLKNYNDEVRAGRINPHVTPPSATWQESKNFVKRNLINSPLGIAYNSIKLALSPTGGDWTSVKKAIDKGWDSGRVLYTQVYDSSVRAEYERRLDQGENPELLAMELQNPWAEMVGQIILDPLNLVGIGAKGAKVAGKIDEAMDAGEAMIKMLDSTMDENVELFAKVATDEAAQRTAQDIAKSYVEKTAERVEVRAQKYGWTQLTSTSQKARLQRDMSNFLGTTISGMRVDGRSGDDIASILKFGIQSVAGSSDEVVDASKAVKAGIATDAQKAIYEAATAEANTGIMGLMNSSVPKQFFSELGNDSLATIRRMMTNSEGVIDPDKILKVLSGDNPLEGIMKLADNAAAQRFASVNEMEKAAKAVESGKFTDAQAKLAKAYESVPEHVKNFTKIIRPAEKTKDVVNSGLGLFYFTINPGTAVRNSISNKMFIMADEGLGAFFQDGLFKGIDDIKGHLTKHLGYEYNVGKTFGSQAGNAPNLMAKIESADALRVIDTRYTEAFGKITETALPFEEGLKTAGMSDGQFKMFKELVKKEGNMQDAMKAFNQAQGLADWRTLDFLDPTQVTGLKQTGSVWDELLDLASNPTTSLEDVNKFIDSKVRGYADKAAQSVDDVPGFSHKFDNSEDLAQMGKAVDEKVLSNADYTKEGQIQEAANQAIDEYDNTLMSQINVLKNNDLQAAFDISQKNSQRLLEAKASGKTVRKEIDGMWKLVWDTKKSGNTSTQVWKELGFIGTPPANKQDFFNELFSQARLKRSAKWEEHFATAINRSEEVIKDLEKAGQDTQDLERLFSRAKELSAKSEEYRSAIYLNNGKAYVGSPPKGTKLSQMDYDSTSRFLKDAGWDRGTADRLKNAVNKDRKASGLQPYEKWQDVTWDEAIGSVQARQGKQLDEEYRQLAVLLDTASPEDVPTIQKRMREIDNVLRPVSGGEKDLIGAATETAEKSAKNLDEATQVPRSELPKSEPLIPMYPAGADPSVPRQFLETQKGFTETMEYLRSHITENWGTISGTDNAAVSRALAEYGSKHANKLIDAKSMALKTAEYWRDFTLLGYSTDKTFGNLAQSYVMPYAFWYSGTYRNMMERLVTDPQVIAGYAKYKHAMEQEHKFAPDWYKQQVKVENLFGIELENPLYFNLEQTLWPLNGLTGVDFNDKSKRVDWWTSTLDDMGKFGPSVWAPVQAATAAVLAYKGEEEAAHRWAGRMAPQTPGIKAVSSLLFKKPVELDPFVLLSDPENKLDIFKAMDAYEVGRVGRALGDVQQREIDAIMADMTIPSDMKQQALAELEAKYTDIAYTHQGPEWEEAYRLATNLRAPGNITSPLLGVGFKARTNVDLEIDDMYTQMNQLITMRDGMNKEDYQKAWGQLREQYPFMDTVLLSRKGGDLRDAAYTYNVLGRIQPGKTDDIFRAMKIDDLANRFYDNKGDMSDWNSQDKDRFMSTVTDIAALFAAPPDATKQEWQAAKNASGEMYTYLKGLYGDDIIDKSQEYYAIRDKDYQAGKFYMEAHPEVSDYIATKNDYLVTNPLLYKYYGSLQTIENYYNSQLRAELETKHGDDIFEIAATYSAIPRTDDGARKQWTKDNPKEAKRLFAFWDDYYSQGTQRKVNEAITRMSERLPEGEEPVLRGEPDTVAQQALLDAIVGQRVSAEELANQMPESLKELIVEFWNGEDLPDVAIKELDYIGQRYDMSGNDVLLILQTSEQ